MYLVINYSGLGNLTVLREKLNEPLCGRVGRQLAHKQTTQLRNNTYIDEVKTQTDVAGPRRWTHSKNR
jgi:hypothetical protein